VKEIHAMRKEAPAPVIDTHVPDSGGFGALNLEWVLTAPFVIAAVLYFGAVVTEARRGRSWPWYRSGFWVLGLATSASGFAGPLAAAAHSSFTAHMATHLLVGMVAPLFLVLGTPVTLALRSLSVAPARRLSRLLRSPVGRALTNPVVAALLSVGGMWLVYRTGLYQLMQQSTLMHLLVMAHFLVAGYLYTVSLIPADPSPHRLGFAMRSSVLVLSLAGHGVLAKVLYANPLPGVTADEAHTGAQLMFYGGDLVDFVLIVLLWTEWYRVTGRRLSDSSGSVSSTRTGPVHTLTKNYRSTRSAFLKGKPS
jgi:putative membrane protein